MMQVPSGGGGAVAAAPAAGGAAAAPAAEEKKPEKEEEKVCTLNTRRNVEANIECRRNRTTTWALVCSIREWKLCCSVLFPKFILTPYRRSKCTAPTLQGDIGSGDSAYRNAGGPIKTARPATSAW